MNALLFLCPRKMLELIGKHYWFLGSFVIFRSLVSLCPPFHVALVTTIWNVSWIVAKLLNQWKSVPVGTTSHFSSLVKLVSLSLVIISFLCKQVCSFFPLNFGFVWDWGVTFVLFMLFMPFQIDLIFGRFKVYQEMWLDPLWFKWKQKKLPWGGVEGLVKVPRSCKCALIKLNFTGFLLVIIYRRAVIL